MKLRQLGAQGPKVSAMGIGAMSFGGMYAETSDKDTFAVLDAAMDTGVTHIDTSNIYGMGRSETVIGAFFKDRGAAARDHFTIATKAGISSDAAGNRMFDNSAEHLETQLDQSLDRLGVDCVDLFYVHRREASRPIEEVTETLAGLVAKGKTKSIGFSEIAPTSLRRAHEVHPVAAVQTEYSLQTRLVEMGLIQTCAELGTALVAFSPVGRSLLTDKPAQPDLIASNFFLKVNPRFLEPNYSKNLELTAPFRALAADMGLSAAGLAMAWVTARGDHVLPIPGTRTADHFAELVAGANTDLTEDQIVEIEKILPIGWCHGDRYSAGQNDGPERYC